VDGNAGTNADHKPAVDVTPQGLANNGVPNAAAHPIVGTDHPLKGAVHIPVAGASGVPPQNADNVAQRGMYWMGSIL